MCLNRSVAYLFFLCSTPFFSQQKEIKKDSTTFERLDEVVVTGQLKPQSIKKSVFEVKVITAKDIERRAGNNLADLLSQTLNIDVFQSARTGKSEISVLGLDGKYFKVLIDNIPIVNEEGFGSNTDLTLINLEDVAQIELVQGAMGVQYGANAISGVLNIITKKRSKYKWQAKTFVQEETIGKEYGLFNEGRHIQSLSVRHQLTKQDYISASYSRNDFKGFLDTLKGKSHFLDDRLRGHSWLPKEQNFAKLVFSHKKGSVAFFYKFDYLHESIAKYDSVVRSNFLPATGTSNPSAMDERFINERFVHHANASGHLGKVLFDVSLSYQKQDKKRESFTYYITEDRKENVEEALFLSKDVWFSRGTFSNLLDRKKFKLLAGYEYTNESGFSSAEATSIIAGEEKVTNTLRNLDVFTSSEIILDESFSVQPGIRASFTNLFGTQLYYETSARKLLKNNWEARAVLGFGTRTPNFDELYTYFVDVNHDVRGNLNLNPEEGISTFFHLKKHATISDNLSIKNKLTFSYINVADRIELITINEFPLQFEYNNIDDFRSIGTSLENDFYYKNLKLSIGASYFAIKKNFNFETEALATNQGNFQLNTNFTYSIPKINTAITGYYKFIGETNRFLLVDGVYQNQIIDPYGWFDMTINKKLLDDKIDITLGARNLFNVVEVTTNGVSNGAHSGTSNSVVLGYGRSYFLKLGYNLKI